ncbi:metal-dependent hydrolase [Marinobacter salinexigens]|uniref:Metal-dependent hydrolase n=1 Tax=Marinobacter salinexigens TaxID=2919747 RepID=A0A5B0VLQ1_9GAMM|nr:metal-dependent hydrolase [Marinobacter salinexigens]KAA1175567.1 metal-dependent hydrolase [Marinobacter salinexigens]
MDSITQVALGSSLAGAVAGRTLGRSALLVGAVLGTLPDLDVVIDYGSAIANFTYHRGFSHSLLVLAPLALLLAWAGWRWKPELSFPRWLTLTALVLITHPLLDAFTTYGTQLFWPFGSPVAVNSIFIIDPMYTLPLIVGCLAFLIRPPAKTALTAGLALSSLYLGWTVVAQQIITDRVQPVLADTGMATADVLVQPMPFNTLLWRVTAITESRRSEIVTGFLDGGTRPVPEFFERRPDLANMVAGFPEAQRLEWFTRGFLAYSEVGDQITATDIRLGLPGAHPFTFVLARYSGDQLEAVISSQLPRPAVAPETLSVLWSRITGETPVLCLASLSPPVQGQTC